VRSSWAAASRVDEVRAAARSWHGAGAIDAPTRKAIEDAYPSGRPALATAWTILIFVIVSIAINCVAFGIFEASGAQDGIGLCLVFGAILCGAAEALRGSRVAGNGSDSAISFWALGYLIAGFGLLVAKGHDEELTVTVTLLFACLILTAACWHWGFEAYGVLAAAALFLLIGRFPFGRALWIAVGAALIAAAAPRLDRDALAPPLRRAFAGTLAVAAIAIYAAVNAYSVEMRWIEMLSHGGGGLSAPRAAVSPATLAASVVAMVLVPLICLLWGIRSRRPLLLNLGALFAALSLVTLRYYVHVAPLWVVLVASGAALVLGALWLNRFLRKGVAGERGGFTALSLSSRTGSPAALAVVAGFAPGSAGPPADPGGGMTPGGGQFGGGGATGSF
jgi:hypothetical protein